jgi:hypothetical protein
MDETFDRTGFVSQLSLFPSKDDSLSSMSFTSDEKL